MASSSSDSWMKEYNEAVKLADDITSMISERISFPASGPETQRLSSSIRRKITILGTRLDSLQSLLSNLAGKHRVSEKEINQRNDMLANLRSKVTQMDSMLANLRSKVADSMLNMSNFANSDSLVGPETKPDAKEELDLQNGLTDESDQHLDARDSWFRRVQKNFAIIDKRTNGGCSGLCMVVVIWMLVKYLK